MRAAITGAADGIGRALAFAFGRAGYAVTGIDVDAERSEAAARALEAEGVTARFLVSDLANPEGVWACAQRLAEDDVDVLIHTAGISAVGRLPEVPLAEQLRVVDLNLTAPMTLTARLLEAGRIRRGGTIVFVSSLSHYVGYPGASVYAATKDGVASYARSLRVDLRRAGLNVLTVFPGPTRTAHARRYSPDNTREAARMAPEELARRILAAVAAGRRELVPGMANRAAALAGRWLPSAMERLMVRTILDRLDSASDGGR